MGEFENLEQTMLMIKKLEVCAYGGSSMVSLGRECNHRHKCRVHRPSVIPAHSNFA